MGKMQLPEFKNVMRSKGLNQEKYTSFLAHWARKLKDYSVILYIICY